MNIQLKNTNFLRAKHQENQRKPAKKQQIFESLKKIKHKENHEKPAKKQQLF